jgi:hypothetical protein
MENLNTQTPPPNYLVKAILMTVLLCPPFGIPAIIFASKVDSLWAQGQHEAAWHASAQAKKWSNIALIVGLAMIPLCILYVILVLAASFI